MRMLDPAGWTLAGLTAEFGAAAVFKVSKGLATTSVEGLAGADRCFIERQSDCVASPWPPLAPAVRHPIRLHATPLLMAHSEASESTVWNMY